MNFIDLLASLSQTGLLTYALIPNPRTKANANRNRGENRLSNQVYLCDPDPPTFYASSAYDTLLEIDWIDCLMYKITLAYYHASMYPSHAVVLQI